MLLLNVVVWFLHVVHNSKHHFTTLSENHSKPAKMITKSTTYKKLNTIKFREFIRNFILLHCPYLIIISEKMKLINRRNCLWIIRGIFWQNEIEGSPHIGLTEILYPLSGCKLWVFSDQWILWLKYETNYRLECFFFDSFNYESVYSDL